MGNECCTQDIPDAQYHRNVQVDLKKSQLLDVTEVSAPTKSEIVQGVEVPRPDLLPAVASSKAKYQELYPDKVLRIDTSVPNSRPPFRLNKNGNVYQGQWLNDDPHGKGKVYLADGRYYEGDFVHGIANGHGRMIFTDGSYFVGQVVNNQAEGRGTFTSKDISYRGDFHRNRFHGAGFETNKGFTFEGEYILGQRTKGTMKWGEENSYIGELDKNGKFTGKGELITSNGKYNGEFFNGEKHGKGVYITAKNLKYEGSYERGLKSGEGIFYNSDGTISYEGQWKNDLPNGRGRSYRDGKPNPFTDWIDGICKSDLIAVGTNS